MHLISMVCWFAGLFYLPRLYVYHALSIDKISQARFQIMERKLYYGIMLPSWLATVGFGCLLINSVGWQYYRLQKWLHLKLVLVIILSVYHWYCGVLRKRLIINPNCHSHIYFRWLNEIPVFFLVSIILLAVLRPF